MSYKEPDLDKGTIGIVVVFIAVVLLIALCGHMANDMEVVEQPPAMNLTLNAANAKEMHLHGMPTAEDAMHYKMHGAWGYRDEKGNTVMFNRLPGEPETWYDFYGI